MKRMAVLVSLVMVCVWSPLLAQAPSWGLMKGEAVNVHADFIDVTRVLLAQHLSEQGVAVVQPEEGESVAQLWGRGIEALIKFSIVRMGENVKISVQRLAADGTVTVASNMTAGSPDDLDSVTARLARHLVTGKAPQEGESIYEVTDREQEQLKKKKSTTYYGLRVVGVHSFTSNLNDYPMKYGAGFSVLYDPRFFLAEVYTNMYGGSDDPFGEFSWELGVGGYYPLTDQSFCPYVGGTLGVTLHGASWEGREWDTDGGLTVGAAVGVLLGRTADIIARAELRFMVDTFSVGGEFSSGIMGFASIGF